ncbi:tetratricopeptide repeat protein [Labilibaculum euxinus]
MTAKKILSLLLFLVSISGYPQSKIDSLILISKTQFGTEQLQTNLKIAETFGYGENGDTIIYYASRCHEQSIALNDSIALLKSTLYWGSGLFSKQKYLEAIKKTDAIFELAEKLKKKDEIVQGLYLKAKCYQRLHEYPKAIDLYQKAYNHSMKILAEEENKHIGEYCKGVLKQMTYCYWYASKMSEGIELFNSLIEKNKNVSDNIKRAYYSNIAFLYNQNSDLIKAENYLLKAIEISQNSTNWKDNFQDLAYLGVLYTSKGEYDKAIINYKKALTLAQEQDDTNMISYINTNLGKCYEHIGDLRAGVSLLYNGIEIFHNRKDSIGIAIGYLQLGNLMAKWNNYKDAKKYYKKSLSCNQSLGLKAKVAEVNLDLAISCMLNNEKDSSLYYLTAAENLLANCQDQKFMATYHIYKAENILKFYSEPDVALKHAIQAQHLAKKFNIKPTANLSKLTIGKCYMAMDSLLPAKKYILSSWRNYKSMKRLYERASAAKSLSIIYKKLQQPDSAYFYLAETDKINSKIRERDQTLALYKKDSNFAMLLTKKEKDLLTKENKRLFNRISLLRIFYISSCLILSGFLFLYLKRRTKKFHIEINKKELAQKELEKQSKQHKSTILKSKDLIQAKEIIIEELNAKLKQNQLIAPNNSEFNEIECLLSSKLSTEEDWDDYLFLFSRKNPHFISTLKHKYPFLSRNEIMLFILIKLGLTTREMAGILLISPSSVNTARYRLRKKLDLKPTEKLENIVESIQKQTKDETRK